MSDQIKYLLDESRMPKAWYNIAADLPVPLPPPLHPGTLQPLGPDDLAPIFPNAIIAQEMSTERYIDIPEPVRDVLCQWRPSPLFRARRLEKLLGTPAKIYFKYEGVSPAGSHKPNSAVPQAWYNAQEGVKRLATETGAGQWGSSLAYAGGLFGLDVTVFQVRVSYDQKPYRRALMETWGARCIPLPSPETDYGRAVLAEHPDHIGSLGIAISEAVEVAAKNDDTKYALGSVLNHVVLHQTIVGLEAKKQLEIAGEFPDVVIGCCGGGSNFAGLVAPFVPDYLEGKKIEFHGYEPASCPTMTAGKLAYDSGDVAMMTPLLYMYTLGHDFVPPGIHAGGLRYHGMAPIVSALVREGIVQPKAVHQMECFEAGILFARTEGIIPAPESNHAIRGAIIEAMKDPKEEKTILFNLSGTGVIDMPSYDNYLTGKLSDYAFPREAIEKSLARLPKIG